MTMQLVDRIEKRRFVGREFLLWLWFECEIFEGTVSTKETGEVGLWIEKTLVVSAGREVTRIKGTYPAGSREAKEALLLGKLPESFGLHLSMGDRESTFVLKAETMAISGLSLPTVLGKAEDEVALRIDRPPPVRKKKKRGSAEDERAEEVDDDHESFYERMQLTRDVEALIEALYRDFITLRLGPTWAETIEPALHAWASSGEDVDAEVYGKARNRALGARRK